MKIHLKQIPAEGLQLEGEEDCPLSEVPDVLCAGPLRYRLDLGISDGALWANGELAQKVELRCVACLEKFEHEIKVPAFALHTELHGPETVDLTPFMREDLLLNLPAYPHCDRDGGRACRGAKVPASVQEVENATTEKREHDWEALDKLRLKN